MGRPEAREAAGVVGGALGAAGTREPEGMAVDSVGVVPGNALGWLCSG